MRVTSWTCTLPSGQKSDELAVTSNRGRAVRLLVLPALFDEANKLRRQTVEVMRRLDALDIDSFLPDLPGMNESLVPLDRVNLDDWRCAARLAAQQIAATHVLAWRGGALLAPEDLPGWSYAPLGGAKQLRSMLRARTISAREAGREEKITDLQEKAREHGLELAGWQLSATMFAQLDATNPPADETLSEISQSAVGGTGLWLRAEPDENPEQAETLANLIAANVGASEGQA